MGRNGMNRITTLIVVVLIAVIVTGFVVRTMDEKGAGACDVHPQLSDSQIASMRANIERARSQAFSAATADRRDKDAANKAGEEAAFDTFVHDLRDALAGEYLRHRRSMDGCY